MCGTAIPLLVWLSLSFWLQAWQQRRDAITWERESVVQDALFAAVQALTAESMLSDGSDAREVFGIDSRGLLQAARASSDGALTEAVRALSASSPDRIETSGLPVAGSRSDDDQARVDRLATMHARLRVDRAVDDAASDATANASPEPGLVLRDAVDSIVRDVHQRLEWQQSRTRSREPAIERLQHLRALVHTMAEGVVADVRLATGTADDGGTWRRWDRRARVRGADALASIAAFTREERGSEALLGDESRDRVVAMLERTRTVFDPDVSVGPLDTADIVNRERIAFEALDDVAALDEALATRVRARVETLRVDATRRLWIDGLLLGACALLVLATAHLLRALRHRATHDPLTGLADRAWFEHRLERALASNASTSGVALALLDLDGFKQVNDVRGHAMGDELLRGIARAMTVGSDASATAGRLGGDEFVWMFVGAAPAERATRALDALIERVETDPAFAGVSVSAGLVVAPQDGHSVTDLLRRADLSMYDAKRSGGARVRRFHPGLDTPPDCRTAARDGTAADRGADIRHLPVPRRLFVDERRHGGVRGTLGGTSGSSDRSSRAV